jgi:hypothetical protein
MGVLGALLMGAVGLGCVFLGTLKGGVAKSVEVFSGMWTLALYLMLGVVPLLARGGQR